ncbi:hypothetical protein MKW98_027941 [Papaver atlanticum]|uniref:Uncharacterized protein n=1 Tax=Papaver atlanticum TaxID=357466 RepID=A0AAD4XC30_9MAGN|nr:hypothetical protein MKW98_027941 [Papaver atlanticum]
MAKISVFLISFFLLVLIAMPVSSSASSKTTSLLEGQEVIDTCPKVRCLIVCPRPTKPCPQIRCSGGSYTPCCDCPRCCAPAN